MSQAALSAAASVSRRWLSDLEAGKATVEIGLVFRVLHALELTLEAWPNETHPDDIDLDDVLRAYGQLGIEETGRR